jgi:hypothetical protein
MLLGQFASPVADFEQQVVEAQSPSVKSSLVSMEPIAFCLVLSF